MEYLFTIINELINVASYSLGFIEQIVRTLPETPNYLLESYLPKGTFNGTKITKSIYQTSKSLTGIIADTFKFIRQKGDNLKIPVKLDYL